VLAAVEQTLDKYHNMHGEVAIARNENILWNDVFSYSDAPYHVKKGSQYLIGSVTKQFTAVALLKALDDLYGSSDERSHEKIIDALHGPISSFSLLNLSDIFNGDIPDWVHSVSMHHLLTHTSGIKKANEAVLQNELEFKPGEKFCYLNAGYVFLGKIIKSIVGCSIENYFKETLFFSAGMQDTYLPNSGTPNQIRSNNQFNKLALGFEYNLIPDTAKITSAADKIDFSELDVAGGIVSTMMDLVKWNRALYSGKILSAYLFNLLTTGYITKESSPLYDGLNQLKYGYGIDVYNALGKISYHHSGGVPGYQSRLIYLPDLKISIVHLSNSQQDYGAHKAVLSKIAEENGGDVSAAEKLFNEQYPKYQATIAKRANIFNFTNDIRDGLLFAEDRGRGSQHA